MNNRKFKLSKAGYALLAAIIAINLFAVFVLKARAVWETELQRDLEEELVFRARQYVTAIDFYMKKTANIPFQKLEDLVEKKFLRKLFKDPITNSDKWNIVMRSGASGKGKLLIVPQEMLPQYITQATIVGVASPSCEEGFKVYRKKKKYCEWAFYIGEDESKDMPELDFVDESTNPNPEDGKDEDGNTIDEREKEEPSEERTRPDESGRERPDTPDDEESREIEPGR